MECAEARRYLPGETAHNGFREVYRLIVEEIKRKGAAIDVRNEKPEGQEKWCDVSHQWPRIVRPEQQHTLIC